MQIFTIQREDINGRLDCYYYQPEFVELEKKIKKKTNKTLGDFVLGIAGGATPNKLYSDKYYAKSADDGIPFLRVQNITNEGLDFDNCKYIKAETHQGLLKRSQVKEDYLITKITGVGRMAVSSVAPKDFEGNINQHLVAIKTKNHEVSEALASFLNSDIGERLASRRSTGGTRPALDYKALLSIPVILNPKIVSVMQSAYKAKEEKLKQADELLNSIDGYVREQLGIDYTEPEEEKIYTVNSQDLEDNRQDPYYYNPKFPKLIKSAGSKLNMTSLSDVTESVFNGNTPAKDKYEDGGKPIIKVSCLKKNRIEWSNLAHAKPDKKLNKHMADNDILLLCSAHQAEYLGKNPCLVEIPANLQGQDITFVGELICIRPNAKLVNPYYLLAILRLDEYHQLINREKRGQTSHIYPDDLEKIKIPLADKGKQDTIAQEFKNRLNKAEELKNEASNDLEEAKKKIEEMILN